MAYLSWNFGALSVDNIGSSHQSLQSPGLSLQSNSRRCVFSQARRMGHARCWAGPIDGCLVCDSQRLRLLKTEVLTPCEICSPVQGFRLLQRSKYPDEHKSQLDRQRALSYIQYTPDITTREIVQRLRMHSWCCRLESVFEVLIIGRGSAPKSPPDREALYC